MQDVIGTKDETTNTYSGGENIHKHVFRNVIDVVDFPGTFGDSAVVMCQIRRIVYSMT